MNDREQDIFWGYRPLITHNRKRNTIPAQILNGEQPWLEKSNHRPENRPAQQVAIAQAPKSAQRALAGHDEAVIFNSKVEALIEHFKPFGARMREGDCKWRR